jgi:hypothetical protein
MNEPQPIMTVPILDIGENRSTNGDDPMLDVFRNTQKTIPVGGYELRIAPASHPHTQGDHLVLWVCKPVTDKDGKVVKLLPVEWSEFVINPQLQDEALGEFEKLIILEKEKPGFWEVAGLHLGSGDKSILEKLDPNNQQFQRNKVGLQSVPAVHFYVIGESAELAATTTLRKESIDKEPELAAKDRDLAGIAAMKLYEPEVRKIAEEFGGELSGIPNKPERPALKMKTLKQAMEAAIKLQAAVMDNWYERITELSEGLVGLLANDPDHRFAYLAIHQAVAEAVKQLLMPSMLVAVDEIGTIWLVPFSAGISASELFWNRVIKRKNYDR